VLDDDALKKLHRLLADRIGQTKIVADCVDDVAREFENLPSLLNYENAKSKRIVKLRLSARSDDFGKTSSIEFTDEWPLSGTSISIEARDDVVSRLRSELLDVISGMRPWYHPVNRISPFFAVLAVYMVTWISVLIVAAASEPNPTAPTASNPSHGSAAAQLIFLGFLAVLLLGACLLHFVRKLFFPFGTFRIGQGAIRDATLEKWRWGLLIAFIASFAAGIALLLIQ
jgi:hypothetical protein